MIDLEIPALKDETFKLAIEIPQNWHYSIHDTSERLSLSNRYILVKKIPVENVNFLGFQWFDRVDVYARFVLSAITL